MDFFRFQIESLKFSHKQEVNNIKLEFTLSQGELEKERNKLQALIEGKNKLSRLLCRTNFLGIFIVYRTTNVSHLSDVCVCVCVSGFQTEVELLRAEITQLKATLVEKEREMCRKVQSVRDEEFRKTVALQEEKSVLFPESCSTVPASLLCSVKSLSPSSGWSWSTIFLPCSSRRR